MKKFLLLLFMLLTLQSFAAEEPVIEEVTSVVEETVVKPTYNPQPIYAPPTFLGIPIDGSKSWFESQLIKKRGFIKQEDGYLYGKFNGNDVALVVFENKAKHLVSLVRVSYYPYFYSSAQFLIRKHNDLFVGFSKSPKYKRIKGKFLNYSDIVTIIKDPANLTDTGDVLAELDYFSFANRVEDGITYVYNGCVTIEMIFFSAELYGMQSDKYNLFLNYYNLDNAYDNSDL